MSSVFATGSHFIIRSWQFRAARAALRLGGRDVAEGAEMSTATITKLEKDTSATNVATLTKVMNFYQNRRIRFVENGVLLIDNSVPSPDLEKHGVLKQGTDVHL